MALKNLKLSLLKKKSAGSSSMKSSQKNQKSLELDETEVTLSEGEEYGSSTLLEEEQVPENAYNKCISCSTVAEEEDDEFDYYAHLTQQPDDAAKYGYGDEPTEEATEDKYDHYAHLTKEPDDAAKYGYGDEEDNKVEEKYDHYANITKVPDDASKYGYGDDEPAAPEPQRNSWTPPRRRVTMNHYTKTPRRSSMKGSSPVPPKSRKRHSLTFNTHVEVTTITPVRELTKKKSTSTLFYKDEEYDQMRDEIDYIADLALEGKEEEQCTRGLEAVIGPDTTNRKYNAWDAVLDEQFKQWDAGMQTYDDEAFAKTYKRTSKESKAEANARALQDAKEVAEYLAETRRFCRRMSM